jgi:hypothetical protein
MKDPASISGKRFYAVSQTGSNIIEVFEAETREKVFSLEATPNAIHHHTFSPDYKYLVTWTYNNVIEIWDMQTGKKVSDSVEHVRNSGSSGSLISNISFSPDGHYWILHFDSGETKLQPMFGGESEYWWRENYEFVLDEEKSIVSFVLDNRVKKRWRLDNGATVSSASLGKLDFDRLNNEEKEALKVALRKIHQQQRAQLRSKELIDRAVRSFDEAHIAAEKREFDKYLVRAGFGTIAAILGWGGQILVKLSGTPNVILDLLKKYNCTEMDWETFPSDFV